MSVIELDEEKKQGILVHGYQAAGSSLQDHIKYLYYIFKNFNISFMIIDHAGADTFIDAVNNSQYFKDMNRSIKFIDFDSDAENEDYSKMLKEAARQYNKDIGAICVKQYFTSAFLGRANSYLQTCIDHKKIWFASRASNHPEILENMFTMNLPMDYVYPRGIGDRADNEYETKKLTYSNAGHNPILIYHAKERKIRKHTVKGMAIGFLEKYDYIEDSVIIEKDDIIKKHMEENLENDTCFFITKSVPNDNKFFSFDHSVIFTKNYN
jgi:hypothetical protein